MSLRIAVSGSAGTGKTTLGRSLAESLEIPFIEEGMRERIEKGLVLHELSLDERRELLVELWQERARGEREAGPSFVSDRSAYDYMAFWLHYGFHADVEETEAWFERWRQAAQHYDRVLLLPWGVMPLAEDGVRSTNRWIQFHYHALLEGILRRFAQRGQVLRVPGTGNLEQRLKFVRRYLPDSWNRA